MINFEGIPNNLNPEEPSRREQNKEIKQEEIGRKSPLMELNEKTGEIIGLIEKGFEESLSKEETKRLKGISGHLDKRTLSFVEEDTEHTWNFLQEQQEKKEGKTEQVSEQKSPLAELHEKTVGAIALIEKSFSSPLNKEEKEKLEKITTQLDEETREFIEEKTEHKWNFLQEQKENEQEKKSEEKNENSEEVLKVKADKLRQARLQVESPVGKQINLMDKELLDTLSEEEKKELEGIKNQLGKKISHFIEQEALYAWGFGNNLDAEKSLQKLMKMSPEKMAKEAEKMEKQDLKFKKELEEFRNTPPQNKK